MSSTGAGQDRSQGPSCNRFETEGLLRLERGEPLDGHFLDGHLETCPECRQARAVYERLIEDLATVDEAHRPADGWQERVRARIEAEDPAERETVGSARPWPALLAAVLVLAIGLGLWLRSQQSPVTPAGLEVTIEAGDTVYRGESAEPGDRIRLVAAAEPGEETELRVYLDDRRLLLRCSDAPPCRRSAGRLEAELELSAMGAHRPVLLRSKLPLPAPSGEGLDRDLGLAAEAGADLILGDEIHVR